MIEKSLAGEMNGYLDEGERINGNKLNDKVKKTLKSGFEIFDIDTPQDLHRNLEPELLKKKTPNRQGLEIKLCLK
ncbi:hypothetical protein [Euzebyella saccharophila]|uniref:Uncharacterized protein n=1 Tax=Euzebyella saccharophila TaxID=679664 RepID=A0ABV8JXD2_9FLAO|nr:hypothetical protein [Euzebyella saccharophila]